MHGCKTGQRKRKIIEKIKSVAHLEILITSSRDKCSHTANVVLTIILFLFSSQKQRVTIISQSFSGLRICLCCCGLTSTRHV